MYLHLNLFVKIHYFFSGYFCFYLFLFFNWLNEYYNMNMKSQCKIFTSIRNINKSIYFVKPNTQWFSTHKSFAWNVKNQNMFISTFNFHLIFCLVNYHQNQNLLLSLFHRNNSTYNFSNEFLLIIISLHFYNILLVQNFFKFVVCDIIW